MNPKIVVVKVGGSLFVQPHFADRLQALIASLSDELAPVHLVLIAGGGVLVHALRAIDRANALSTEYAHWAAIELMDANADILRHFLPQLHSTRSFDELKVRCSRIGVTQFRAAEFLSLLEPNAPGTKLPLGWEVTSDSIAARVTEVLDADELVLLKSVERAPIPNWQAAAKAGLVDPFFPVISSRLRAVRWEVLPQRQD